MKQDDQKLIEHMFSKSNIRKAIRTEILETEGVEELLSAGVGLLADYCKPTYSYESKNQRVSQLSRLDLREIVIDVISITLFIQKPVLFTQTVGTLAGALGFSDKADGIKTAAEILAVLCELDLYDITKEDKFASLRIVSTIAPSEKLTRFIEQTKYLPPMICPPTTLRSNYDSGYLTKKDSLILGGSVNFHEGDICLDNLNRLNQIPLTLNQELLRSYSEPPRDFDNPEKKARWQATHPGENWELELQDRIAKWESMVRDSIRVYVDLIKQGNEFYLTHKTDKRGRTYAQGYHVSTQGNSYRKAIIDLAEKEVIEGV